jgi:hypothetical protein
MKNTAVFVMSSVDHFMVWRNVEVWPPCNMTDIGSSSNFGAMIRRFRQERILFPAFAVLSHRKLEFGRTNGSTKKPRQEEGDIACISMHLLNEY